MAGKRRAQTVDPSYGLVVLGALLWGTLGTAGSELARTSGMSSAEISSWRLSIGGVILLAIATWTGELRRVPRTWVAASRVAFTSVMTAVCAITFLEAIERLGVASATVVALGLGPVFILLASPLRGQKVPLGSSVAGSIMALGGLVLVCGPDAFAFGADSESIVGVAYGLVCGAAFAGMTMINRRRVEHLGPITFVGLTFCGSGLLTAAAVMLEPTNDVRLTAAAVSWLVYMAVVPTALGYVVYFAGLGRGVPASSAMITTLLELVSAATLAVVVLHESIGALTGAGSALIIAAAVVMRPKAHQAEQQSLGA